MHPISKQELSMAPEIPYVGHYAVIDSSVLVSKSFDTQDISISGALYLASDCMPSADQMEALQRGDNSPRTYRAVSLRPLFLWFHSSRGRSVNCFESWKVAVLYFHRRSYTTVNRTGMITREEVRQLRYFCRPCGVILIQTS